MIFPKIDLAQFVKTKIASEIQKTQIGNIVSKNGMSSLSSSVSKRALDSKSKVSDGVNMGHQMNGEFIPIIYGFVGMTNTQFDQGQKPSEVDTKKTVQQLRVAISEGPIAGVAFTNDYFAYQYAFYNANNPDVFKGVVVDNNYVIDPQTGVANYSDIKVRMTMGDGTGQYKQNATIGANNPLTDTAVDSISDDTNTKLLNDLGDVQAGKGENHVLYWNSAQGRWEAKSFNALLNEAGATYDGGAGGAGGDGGDGGSGGLGGTGGVGAGDGLGLRYTQWNPPPHRPEVESDAEYVETITLTNPPDPTTIERGDYGYPMRRREQTTPYFKTTINNVDDNVDKIEVTTTFPDGIYLERTLQREYKDGVITICDSTRPFDTPTHDLECLTPDITISEDGRTVTERDRLTGSMEVYVAFTTTLCGAEFILHEGSYTVSGRKEGVFYDVQSFDIRTDFNAGRGYISTFDDEENAGSQQDGAIDGDGTCHTTDVTKFDFGSYNLDDYIRTYPNQIIQAADDITVYVWMRDKTLDETPEPTISTNGYIKSIAVCDTMDVFETGYTVSTVAGNPFTLYGPDHDYLWEGRTTELETRGWSLENARCDINDVSGIYQNTKNEDPILVWDYTTQGQIGGTGSTGSTGNTGSTGQAGTQGSVTVPNLDPIPSVESSNSVYTGDGVSATFTLSPVEVTYSDPLGSVTLTITIPTTAGDLDVTTLNSGVSGIGRNTNTLTLIGNIADLQTTLNSGLNFTSTTAAVGDIDIDFYISGAGGNTREIYKIRTQAAIEPVAPSFTITVTGTSGYFRCETLSNKFIHNTLNASGTTEEIAEQIKTAINSYTIGSPNWTATRSGSTVTVTGPQALGASYNGVQPTNGATSSPLLATTITEVSGGVSATRVSRPSVNKTKVSTNFLKFGSYTNGLDDVNVAWGEVVYRPKEQEGSSELSDLGFVVVGRTQLQEPWETGPDNPPMSFETWRDTHNYNHAPTDVPDGLNDPDNITFTANPASIFLDYLTNTRYGLGLELDIANLANPYKERLMYDIWLAMGWCLYNGIGANDLFFGAESKIEALQKIAALFDGRFLFIDGHPRLMFEGMAHNWQHKGFLHIAPIKKIVNQTNSANMVYTSNPVDNIYNKINVAYHDRANQWTVRDHTFQSLVNYPFTHDREISLDYWGCGSEFQAAFRAAYYYETEIYNNELVSYVAGWDHYDVQPNDLILLSDSNRYGSATGGRVASVGTGAVLLDRTIGAGVTVWVTDETGVLRTGTTGGDGRTVTIAGDFLAGATWNEQLAAGYEYQCWRVISKEESDDGIYAITAQIHDFNKYNRIYAYAEQFE